jgi:hypothetical protein
MIIMIIPIKMAIYMGFPISDTPIQYARSVWIPDMRRMTITQTWRLFGPWHIFTESGIHLSKQQFAFVVFH